MQAVVPGTNGGTTTFRYDPFGRRIQKSGPLGTTNYLYDGMGLLEEVDSSGNVLARYVQSAGIDDVLAQARSITSYYQQDVLGSVTSLSNSTGALANTYTYDAFGKLTASTGALANPVRYTGREFDQETGIYEYRARYFDQQIGRFISEDPIGFSGGSLNLYGYVFESPTNLVDPFGLQGYSQYFNPWQFPGWVNSAEDVVQEFWNFATGTGSPRRDFGPNSSEVHDLQYSSGISRAREYYARCGVGRSVSGGHKFGLQGVKDSGFNPTLQFAGSYDWTISPTANGTVRYAVTDYKTMHSFAYHLLPSWSRDPFGWGWSLPFGTTEQTYHWTELAPSKSGRGCGCN